MLQITKKTWIAKIHQTYTAFPKSSVKEYQMTAKKYPIALGNRSPSNQFLLDHRSRRADFGIDRDYIVGTMIR